MSGGTAEDMIMDAISCLWPLNVNDGCIIQAYLRVPKNLKHFFNS